MRKLFAALLVSFAATANAAWMTGNALYGKLTSSNLSYQIEASGYIEGVLDGDSWYEDKDVASLFPGPSSPYLLEHLCIPGGATLGQITEIILKYLRDHPETRHREAYYLVFTAVDEAFPCPKPRPAPKN